MPSWKGLLNAYCAFTGGILLSAFVVFTSLELFVKLTPICGTDTETDVLGGLCMIVFGLALTRPPPHVIGRTFAAYVLALVGGALYIAFGFDSLGAELGPVARVNISILMVAPVLIRLAQASRVR